MNRQALVVGSQGNIHLALASEGAMFTPLGMDYSRKPLKKHAHRTLSKPHRTRKHANIPKVLLPSKPWSMAPTRPDKHLNIWAAPPPGRTGYLAVRRLLSLGFSLII